MKIIFTSISLLCTVVAFAQPKNLELRLEILKDTIEYLQPFSYCMYFSNTSNKAVDIYEFPWELGSAERPWMEIKASGEFKWKRLYKSDMVLGLLRGRGPLSNCFGPPRKDFQVLPKAHYCRQDNYYPLWANESQIIWKPNKKYKVRIACFGNKEIGIIYSKPVVVYVNSTAANSGFIDGLLQNGLSTAQIFESWTYCNAPDSIKAKLAALELEYPNTHLSDWIKFQTLECKFTMFERNQKIETAQKLEQAKSWFQEQRILAEKSLADGSIILDLYANSLEQRWWWWFDMDYYEKENESINKMREPKEPSCSCN